MKKKFPGVSLNRWRNIYVAAVYLLLFYLISFLLYPSDLYWEYLVQLPTEELLAELTTSFLFCLLISYLSIIINSRLNRWLPWTDRTMLRGLVQTGLQLMVVFVIIMFQIGILEFFFNVDCEHDPFCNDIWNWVTSSIAIGLIILAVNTGSYFIENWKQAALEAATRQVEVAEQRRLVAESELQALKLQIDPHFVFNSLSALSELILTDQQQGYQYSEHFSKLYRFLLVNSSKDLITVREELKILESYIFMVKIRLGEGVSFSIDVGTEINDFLIPPLALQLLVENAIKHNKTTKDNPLRIKIYNITRDYLVVENPYLPLVSNLPSAGVGMNNIEKRYRILSEIRPVVRLDHRSYRVRLPLIKNNR